MTGTSVNTDEAAANTSASLAVRCCRAWRRESTQRKMPAARSTGLSSGAPTASGSRNIVGAGIRIQIDTNNSAAEVARTSEIRIRRTPELWRMGADQRAHGCARVLGDELGGLDRRHRSGTFEDEHE